MAGKPFYCFKFRTMREHAEQIQADLESQNEKSGAIFKIREDPRTTPVGRLLRRFSLDELPQLVNVLRGEMSLVGPRPDMVSQRALYTGEDERKLAALPGLTRLISPRSTLTSWGNSSAPPRSQRPTRVTRSSWGSIRVEPSGW